MSKPSRILMCPPDHFHVNYAINPWMKGNKDQVSQKKAAEQWRNLRDLVARFTEVVEIEPVQGVPDMVFTANAGTVAGNRVVISNFSHVERQPEEAHFARWFRDSGFEVIQLPKGVRYEGAGDSLFDRAGDWLWAGSGFRSDLESHKIVADSLDVDVLSLTLVDERFYHIDTCFCPLSGGWLLYYPEAYDVSSNQLIEKHIPAEKRIEVSEEEAAVFSCNAINIGQNIIMNECSDRLRGELEKAGFQVHTSSLSEFLKAGGSAKCLSLKIDEPEAKSQS